MTGILAPGSPDTAPYLDATHRRLLAVLDVLRLDIPDNAVRDPGALLHALADHAGRQPTQAETWLLLVALAASFPVPADVRAARRAWELDPGPVGVRHLLAIAQGGADDAGVATADLDIVTDRVLVDIDVSARTTIMTGIQRVVRETARAWRRDHDVRLVVWNDRAGAYRSLTPRESARIDAFDGVDAGKAPRRADDVRLVVPWGVPVVALEVPDTAQSPRLAALAEFSPSSVRTVGYDCIPVVSADLLPKSEPNKFGGYIEVVKHVDRIAAISHTAANEFRGLAHALDVQGLRRPDIVACTLPTVGLLAEPSPGTPGVDGTDGTDGLPLVVCLGSVGPRKNQATVLAAAEVLWRKGLEFELRLVGHASRVGPVLDALVERLETAGRRFHIERQAGDARVAELLRSARCAVFPSLHEGFGLPVVEALSMGVPVVTSDHGSLAEVAAGGGTITVEAEDVDAVASAIRALLTDDALHARLVEEAVARPPRTWSDYSTELWDVLCG